MSEKGQYSPFVRRVVTIVLFAGIAGVLVGLYYLIYLPQQHEQFNRRTFRVLKEITNNFTSRVSNYGTHSAYSYIRKVYDDIPIKVKDLGDTGLRNTFKNSFIGDAKRVDLLVPSQRFENDTIFHEVRIQSVLVDSTPELLSDILDPIISIHANTFETVLLTKQKGDSLKGERKIKRFEPILYKSPGMNITDLNPDFLLTDKNVVSSSIGNVEIEGVNYKIFIYPFQLKAIANGTFMFAGLISEESYRQQSQGVPLKFLFGIGFLIVLLLLILPFLKIFVLSVQENISIADVRMIIGAVFIIPLVITLFVSVLWLYKYPSRFSTEVLDSLQDSIKNNFYTEIRQCIRQAKDFDSLINNPLTNIKIEDPCAAMLAEAALLPDTSDAKDIIFYPLHYRNIENVHWMNKDGNDIAAWSFLKQPAVYFKLKDRKYFTDIRDRKGYSLPGSKDTFSIQPVLSRLTGDYTINLAIKSDIDLSTEKKAAVIGISTKMYSVYNTVVPPGFAYCIIDEDGEILTHSDTARNLQENLFEETEYNPDLRVAISHKDSALINDVELNDQPARMMVKPLPGLPYYLVTYFEKRTSYLFIAHILAFVFLCQTVLFVLASLFSYAVMMAEKKMYKLFFIPGGLDWIRPSINQKEYYIKHLSQLMLCLSLVFLCGLFLASPDRHLYMVNAALLLPLFTVVGYYFVRAASKYSMVLGKNNERIKTLLPERKRLLKFVVYMKKIIFLYAVSIFIFAILQNFLFQDSYCNTNAGIIVRVWILIFLVPLTMCLVSLANGRVVRVMWRRMLIRVRPFTRRKNNGKRHPDNYLTYFIISFLTSVFVIAVVPAITFTVYALHEERKLHFQSFQLGLAKKIQQRRVHINDKYKETKVEAIPQRGYCYLDSLKFKKDKGLYLFINELRKSSGPTNAGDYYNCSPFYEKITRFLFLPPDHDEFFNNPTHSPFYSWKETFDNENHHSFTLSYNILTDYKDPSSFELKARVPDLNIFSDITKDTTRGLVILGLLIFVYLFYRIIYSIAKRIFLVGFFNTSPADPGEKLEDKPWLKLKYAYVKIEDLCKPILPISTPTTFATLREKENELLAQGQDDGETILRLHIALVPIYEKIWSDCTDTEKFTLYDFALDGFTNYKKLIVLYQLYEKGLIIKENHNYSLLTKSFRNFLIAKASSAEITALSKGGKGSWAVIRTVFYIILVAVAIFIFISQEEASKRLITIVTSLAALLPVILKLFDKSTFTSNTKSGS